MSTSTVKQPKQDFLMICQEVANCTKCKRMSESLRVLGHSSGNVEAEIMFIGEAPGRLGADASAIPFHGDKSGHNFEDFLFQVGISRYEIFVTNAVLCNPKDSSGNNSTPTKQEVTNCASFLKRQILSIQPRLIVTLGAVALGALKLIENHHLTLSSNVRSANSWFGRQLIPLYHPGQRAMVHRSRSNQLADYHFVAELLRRGDTAKRRLTRGNLGSAKDLVDAITRRQPNLSYFALHKLFYLSECLAIEALGHRLTTSFIVRQKDGPYCVDLHATKLASSELGLRVVNTGRNFTVHRNPKPTLLDRSGEALPTEIEHVVDLLMSRYRGMSDGDLKRCAYLTSPMRAVLRQEKSGKNMLNAPLLREEPNFDEL